jgi:hypothetical protein
LCPGRTSAGAVTHKASDFSRPQLLGGEKHLQLLLGHVPRFKPAPEPPDALLGRAVREGVGAHEAFGPLLQGVITVTYTFWDWGKRKQIKRERQAQITLAHQNVYVTIDKVRLDAAKAYITYEQTREAYRQAEEMVKARKAAEKDATDAQNILATKTETSKAELNAMKAEIAYRVAYAQLAALICKE